MVVRSREVDLSDDLLAYADPHRPLAWLRRGDGIVAAGAGLAAAVRVSSASLDATRTATLGEKWRALVADAEIDDEVELPGTGLLAFGALVFDEESAADSALLVPSLIVGRHRGRSWLTRIGTSDDPVEPRGYGPPWSSTLRPGRQTPERYREAVDRALGVIAAGDCEKVVLARELIGDVPPDADLRRVIQNLATGYPDTWVFAVDGLIGASPETLVTAHDGTVTARVLAGTTARGADADADTAASAALATSGKDLDEHQYAVQSVLATLRPHTRALAASEQPFLLKLPNLFHLATDIEAELADAATALDLVGALHPTAAVAGTPRDAALRVIRELEPFDRGRYAGPVGWVDAHGNGEWGIALRCAQFSPGAGEPDAMIHVTAFAGAGIVAGSDPDTELLETRVKFRPLVDALD